MLECMGVVNGVVVPLLDQSAYVRDCLGYVGAMVKWICLLLLFPCVFRLLLCLFSLCFQHTPNYSHQFSTFFLNASTTSSSLSSAEFALSASFSSAIVDSRDATLASPLSSFNVTSSLSFDFFLDHVEESQRHMSNPFHHLTHSIQSYPSYQCC